jgi:hypothetical protein
LISESELGVSQAEQPHVPISKCLQFSWTVANVVILAKDDPAALTSKRQPSRIVGFLGCLLTIDLSYGSCSSL